MATFSSLGSQSTGPTSRKSQPTFLAEEVFPWPFSCAKLLAEEAYLLAGKEGILQGYDVGV